MAVGEAARKGHMVPGVAAVLLHSWHGGYEKECVPAWDFYPVLEAVSARHLLLYPSARLDRLHSEKRYTSALLPPTQFLHLVRQSTGWQLEGQVDVKNGVTKALAKLRADASSAGLSLQDVMVKQGLSWGGEDVARLAPTSVLGHIKQKLLPKVPPEAATITVLLQAKVDLVAELRWMVLNGKLKGKGWRTYHKPARGQNVVSVGQVSEEECRKEMIKLGMATNDADFLQLEESMRGKVEQVLAEATADAGGEVPQYLRVDLLLDKQGRAWLGERESWGADLVENIYNPRTGKYSGMNPSKSEVAAAIVSRALRWLSGKRRLPTLPRCKGCNKTTTWKRAVPAKGDRAAKKISKRRLLLRAAHTGRLASSLSASKSRKRTREE